MSATVFDDVQTILAGRKRAYTSTVPGRYLLSGLIKCAGCGSRMIGRCGSNRSRKRTPYYCCSGYRSDGRPQTDCEHPTVTASWVESAVLAAIHNHVLTDDNLKLIQRAAVAGDVPVPKVEQEQLEAVQAEIELGPIALWRAKSDADFADVSRRLEDLRNQADRLRRTLRKDAQGGTLAPKDVVSLRVLRECGEELSNVDESERPMLADALRTVLDRIAFHASWRKEGGRRSREWRMSLEFRPDIYNGPPVVLADDQIRPTPTWKKFADFVAAADRPVLVKELAEEFGTCHSGTYMNLCRAEAAGRVEQVRTGPGRGNPAGWVAAN